MNYDIQLYQRPDQKIIQSIVDIAILLTNKWFTANVPEDTEKDLLFQDVFCLQIAGKVISFLIFTCWDGSIHISLMGTHPDFIGKGFGSALMEHFCDYIHSLGFNEIIALTVPPDVKPAYYSTVKFYEKHGFIIVKRYNELWETGAIKLVKKMD